MAPGPHPAVKVPFVIVRREGNDVAFVSLLDSSKGQPSTITVKRREDGTITVRGPRSVDSVTLDNVIHYHRSIVADGSGAAGD
ncbi:MAG: hypothetical protein JWQ49_5727 [Edaphobacter sp.]|nr:hypothetical protein [Edaphobacter sp.]